MQKIIILDFGSQFTHLIKTTLLDLGYNSEIHSGDLDVNSVDLTNYKGIIFSGGAASVYDGLIEFDNSWLETELPILGICYGHQLIIHSVGGKVVSKNKEFGKSKLLVTQSKNELFSELPDEFNVWMSHGDSVEGLPEGFEVLAKSEYSEIASYKSSKYNFYGVQFHPEVSHTELGDKILENFVNKICKLERSESWSPEMFIRENKGEILDMIGNDKVALALSGGVDSMTLAAYMRSILGRDRLECLYVDSGLMPDETESQVVEFCKSFDINLTVREESERFFKVLENQIDPRDKGKVIGHEFIYIFQEFSFSKSINKVLQGTILSDIIESGVSKFSSQIKPHHNVACLPDDMVVEIIEPFKDLFKNQVRDIGRYLKLPDEIVEKKVFPGPGFAIRVDGEVTRKKVEVVRRSTKIVEDIVNSSDISKDIWMAFTILSNAQSLGVRGDKRVWNDYAIVIRIIESKNSMTANFSRKAMYLLPEMSKRIVDETEAGRVVYDVTDKPPATIEWQ